MNELSASEVKQTVADGNLQSLWPYDQVTHYFDISRPVVRLGKKCVLISMIKTLYTLGYD